MGQLVWTFCNPKSGCAQCESNFMPRWVSGGDGGSKIKDGLDTPRSRGPIGFKFGENVRSEVLEMTWPRLRNIIGGDPVAGPALRARRERVAPSHVTPSAIRNTASFSSSERHRGAWECSQI